ncbi:MAG: RIP metalloprotease RseP [bacterium]
MTLVVFILVLGLLVFVHEFGHFIMAKRSGVRVEVFSLGFGPRLAGWKRGDTDYRISAVPLGGYVKMTGEDPVEEAAAHEGSFARKTVLSRLKIVIAGPLMNLALPFLLMPLVYLIGIRQPAYLEEPPRVGWVEEGSPAARAGFQRGDLVEAIQGEPVRTWEQAKILFASNPDRALSVSVLRDDTPRELQVTPESAGSSGGYSGLMADMPPVIGSVSPGTPAEKAGLQQGDRVLSINGEPVVHWVQMAGIIRAHPEEPLLLSFQRGQETLTMSLTPMREPDSQTGVLGIAQQEDTVFKRYGLWRAVQSGFADVYQSFLLTFYVLGKLFTGGLSIKTLGGPILIAKMTGDAARIGLSSLISFVAFLSLQLGILNLLPIPVLDGGHVAFLTLEAVLRRPVNIKIREAAQQVGFVVLLIFILVVSYNDVLRVLHLEQFFR